MTKEKQIRMTLQDCLSNQEGLRSLLQSLTRENRCLAHAEKPEYYALFAKGLLSQGTVTPVYFVHGRGWFVFASVQSMAQRMADLYTNKVFLRTTRPEAVEIKLDISELWEFLYNRVLFLFPQANAEAIHLSAESIERPQQGTYSFSSKEALE